MNPSADKFPVSAEVRALAAAIRDAGGRPVLVGGWVRDSLLGQPHSKDFDIEVFSMPPKKLQKILRGFGAVHQVGRHFGVLKLTTPSAEFDISVPRRESKTGKGHKGFWIDTDPHMTYAQAAARRDFTLNSMGYALLEDEFLDPHGGLRDLERRVLRHVGGAFGEDPLRVMRAMQFAGRFQLTIAPETLSICRTQDLHELPRERMWVEVKKLLLLSPSPSNGLRYAPELGILPYLPELESLHDHAPPAGSVRPWDATLAAVDAAAKLRKEIPDADDLELMLAALSHRLGEMAYHGEIDGSAAPWPRDAVQAAQSLLLRLTNEQGVIDRVCALVRELPLAVRVDSVADGEIRRLALRVSIPRLAELVAAVMSQGSAPAASGGIPDAAAGIERLRRRAQGLDVWEHPPQPLLMGRHLIQAGMQPGLEMGRVLEDAFERQLDGEIETLEEALCWAREQSSAPLGQS